MDGSFVADTQRTVISQYSASFVADTARTKSAPAAFVADVVRRIPYSTTGMKSLSISLQSKTISDTFSMETVNPLALGEMVTGTVLGWPYSFLVAETSQQTDVQRITGAYGVDELLYTPIKYTVSDSANAVQHANAIAAALGKSAVVSIDSFIPSADLSTTGTTYRDIISTLFGWTSELPQRQVNVFIRGGLLYVVQRGKESGTVAITDKYTRPTISRKKIRTTRSSSGDADDGNTFSFFAEPMPFTGTISYGDCSVSYVAGLTTQERHPVNGFVEVTSYSYSGGYLSRKTTVGVENTITTDYDYGGPGSRYLVKETQTTQPNGGGTPEVRTTRHHAVGQGWWATVTEVDGETVSTTLSQGAKGGRASVYSVQQANRSMGSGYNTPDDDDQLEGQAVIDTNWPVSDAATLTALTAATKWLNGRIEERVAFDYYGPQVIDFDKTVTFGGNVYYLERNTITQESRSIKQALELVRWY